MYISINLTPELTEKIEQHIIKELPAIVEETLFKNDNKILKDILAQKVKGLISSQIHEVLQEKEFKNYVRDKIMEFFER